MTESFLRNFLVFRTSITEKNRIVLKLNKLNVIMQAEAYMYLLCSKKIQQLVSGRFVLENEDTVF